MFHKKARLPAPPVIVVVMLPLFAPLQKTFVCVSAIAIGAGSLIVSEAVATQLAASVMVKIKLPCESPAIF